MKSQSQYLVIYKDSTEARNKYFGPFSSVDMAEEFVETLPTPLIGGSKTWKHVSPYTHQEAVIARQSILRQRTHGSYLRELVNTH